MRLYFKNRELSQELRGLQFSNRPVTGRESKSRLEQFFTNAIAQQQNSQAPVTTSNPLAFRSSTVVNELAELNSRQPVSNVLTTSTREAIERTLLQRPNATPVPSANQNTLIPPAPPLLLSQITPPSAAIPVPNPRMTPSLVVNAHNNLITEYTREQIIGEISELVHSHVVSSTLQSEFRASLENRILDSLRRSGMDGSRPRQFIRELARTNQTLILRNDFSHLGIDADTRRSVAGDVDNLDSASSLNEQRVHRSTLRNAKEIRELKGEIGELKSLLKLSFELQLDMQRSLKQEINALISNTFHNSASSISLLNSSRPASEGNCLVCTDAQVDTVFYTCGHMCVSSKKNFANISEGKARKRPKKL